MYVLFTPIILIMPRRLCRRGHPPPLATLANGGGYSYSFGILLRNSSLSWITISFNFPCIYGRLAEQPWTDRWHLRGGVAWARMGMAWRVRCHGAGAGTRDRSATSYHLGVTATPTLTKPRCASTVADKRIAVPLAACRRYKLVR